MPNSSNINGDDIKRYFTNALNASKRFFNYTYECCVDACSSCLKLPIDTYKTNISDTSPEDEPMRNLSEMVMERNYSCNSTTSSIITIKADEYNHNNSQSCVIVMEPPPIIIETTKYSVPVPSPVSSPTEILTPTLRPAPPTASNYISPIRRQLPLIPRSVITNKSNPPPITRKPINLTPQTVAIKPIKFNKPTLPPIAIDSDKTSYIPTPYTSFTPPPLPASFKLTVPPFLPKRRQHPLITKTPVTPIIPPSDSLELYPPGVKTKNQSLTTLTLLEELKQHDLVFNEETSGESSDYEYIDSKTDIHEDDDMVFIG